MPKMNPVLYLTPGVETPGATYHWKPSPRLRRAGWTNLDLGKNFAEAVAAAIARNAEVAALSPSTLGIRRRIARLERHQRWLDRALSVLRQREVESRSPRSWVYFVAAVGGPIKIGCSTHPQQRLATMQTSSAKPLRILVKVRGGRATEADYHARFAPHRLEGEWFARHPDVLDEIRRLRDARSSSNSPPRRTCDELDVA